MTFYSPFKKQLTEEEQKQQNKEVGEALLHY